MKWKGKKKKTRWRERDRAEKQKVTWFINKSKEHQGQPVGSVGRVGDYWSQCCEFKHQVGCGAPSPQKGKEYQMAKWQGLMYHTFFFLLPTFFFFQPVSISILCSIAETELKTPKTDIKITSLKLEKRTDGLGCYIHASYIVLNWVRRNNHLLGSLPKDLVRDWLLSYYWLSSIPSGCSID